MLAVRRLCTMVVVAVGPITARAQGPVSSLPWVVTQRKVVGRDLAFTRLPVVALDGAGLYALDVGSNELFRLDTLGNLLWRAGGKGQGPGEFTQSSRIAVRADGGAIVFDAALNALTFFTPSGRYSGRKDLPLAFSQLDNFVEMPDHSIIIAGCVRPSTPGSAFAEKFAVHVISEDMKWVRSFGPLPESRDSLTVRFWGAGFVSPAADGSLWFVRKLPYELYRFSTEGRQLSKAVVDTVRSTPDEFMQHERYVDPLGRVGVRHALTGKDVPRPMAVIEISKDILVSGLVSRGGGRIDALSRTGQRVGSAPMEGGIANLVGFDAATRVLWGVGHSDDEPVLIRQKIQFTNNKGAKP